MILIPVIVVGVLLFADKRQPAPAAVQVDIVAFNKALAEGDKQLDQAAYDAALASYDQAEAANPVSPAPAVKRGTVYLAQGLTDQAVAQFNAALVKDSTYALAYFMLGEVESLARQP